LPKRRTRRPDRRSSLATPPDSAAGSRLPSPSSSSRRRSRTRRMTRLRSALASCHQAVHPAVAAAAVRPIGVASIPQELLRSSLLRRPRPQRRSMLSLPRAALFAGRRRQPRLQPGRPQAIDQTRPLSDRHQRKVLRRRRSRPSGQRAPPDLPAQTGPTSVASLLARHHLARRHPRALGLWLAAQVAVHRRAVCDTLQARLSCVLHGRCLRPHSVAPLRSACRLPSMLSLIRRQAQRSDPTSTSASCVGPPRTSRYGPTTSSRSHPLQALPPSAWAHRLRVSPRQPTEQLRAECLPTCRRACSPLRATARARRTSPGPTRSIHRALSSPLRRRRRRPA
jgi:hypothetical protein